MKTVAPENGKRTKTDSTAKIWNLRLYVAGQTQKSITAFANLKKICEDHLAGEYSIEVIDLLKNPQLAKGDQIVALPTLVRKLPEPLKRIIGDLANTERVLVGLDIRAAGRPPGREARSQEPGARSQEPGARSQEPGARSQEPGARRQKTEDRILPSDF